MIQQSSTVSSVSTPQPTVVQDRVNVASGAVKPFLFGRIDTTGAELVKPQPPLTHLDFEHLRCFESVEQQFVALGVEFHNAIALRPSNPAFPPSPGQTVLIGAPRSGVLDASFKRPVEMISVILTASRRTVITAFDQMDRAIAKTELPRANLATSASSDSPNRHLQIYAQDIHRIRVRSVGGQFIIGDFAFGT